MYNIYYLITKFIIFFYISFITLKIYFPKEIVSVIIPTFNREKLILNSVNTILNQTYNNLEILIIDDCSTDNTKLNIEIIKDRRIKYLKLNKKSGSNYARNIGIKLATGTYITFQDSDDIYHYDKIEKQLKNLNKHKSDFDFCKVIIHMTKSYSKSFPNNKTINEINKGKIFDSLLSKGNFISTQSILIKKLYIRQYLFDTKIKRWQDYDLVLRIIPNLKVSFTNEVLVELYRHKDNISNSKEKLKKSLFLFLMDNKKSFEKVGIMDDILNCIHQLKNYFYYEGD